MTEKSSSYLSRPASPLRRNFSWTLAGNLIYAACQWGMLMSIANFGSPTMVGQFALAIAISTPIFTLTNLQLRSIQATDPTGRFLLNHYLAVRLAGTSLGFMVVIVASLISQDRAATAVILAIALGKGLDAIADVFYGYFQQNEQMDRIAKAMIFNGVLSLATIAGALWLLGDLVVAGFLSSCVSLLALAMVVLPSAREILRHPRPDQIGVLVDAELGLKPKRDRRKNFHLVWTALPLGFVMLLSSLNTNIPRYFVSGYLGEAELGVFAALAYAIVAGSTVVSALGNSASPRLARLFATGRAREFQSLLGKLLLTGFAIGLAGALMARFFGEWILEVIYTSEYSPYTNVLVILALAGAFSFAGSFLGYGMTATLRYRAQMPVFASVVLATSASCALLVPLFGLPGAAWAMVVGGAVQCGLSLLVIRQAFEGYRLERK